MKKLKVYKENEAFAIVRTDELNYSIKETANTEKDWIDTLVTIMDSNEFEIEADGSELFALIIKGLLKKANEM